MKIAGYIQKSSGVWTRLIFVIYFWNLVASGKGCDSDCCCVVGLYGNEIDCHRYSKQEIPPRPVKNEPGNRRWCGKKPNNPKEIAVIDISGTNASKISQETLRDYPNVINLILKDCKFESLGKSAFSIPGQVSHIKKIDLRNNKLKKLDKDAFIGLDNLEELDLGVNQISDLPLGVFDPLINLKKLRLDRNHLKSIDPKVFRKLTKLKDLVLASNFQQNVPVFTTDLFKLDTLDLRNNSISSVPQDAFKELEFLGHVDLSQNKLSKLPVKIFSKQLKLYSVDLSENELVSLDRGIFSNLCNLTRLDLRKNRLETPSYEWYATVAKRKDEGSDTERREFPATDGNPWNCVQQDRSIRNYTFFLMEICKDGKMGPKGLIRHFNIHCKNTGNKLVDPSSCSSEIILYDEEKSEILGRNHNTTCHRQHGSKHPLCPFMPPLCVVVRPPPLPPPGAITAAPVNIFAMVGGFLGVIILLVGFTVMRRRQRAASLKRSATGLDDLVSEDSITASILGTPPSSPHHSLSDDDRDQGLSSTSYLSPIPGQVNSSTADPNHVLNQPMRPPKPNNRVPWSRPNPNIPMPFVTSDLDPVDHRCRPSSGLGSISPGPSTYQWNLSDIDFFSNRSICSRRSGDGYSQCAQDDLASDPGTDDADMQLKEPISVHDNNTEPKQLLGPEETRPKFTHLQQPVSKKRATNEYTIERQVNSTVAASQPEDPTYTSMRPQVPIERAPSPPSVEPSTPQAVPNHIHSPLPKLPTQLYSLSSTTASKSSHQYYSIKIHIPVAFVPQPPFEAIHSGTQCDQGSNPPLHLHPSRHEYEVEIPHGLPQHEGPDPNCYLHWESSNHVPNVVYRDTKPSQNSRNATRPRSDQQPLLDDSDNSPSESTHKKKKKKETKVKKKKSKD